MTRPTQPTATVPARGSTASSPVARLDHPDQALPRQRIVEHLEIARLEYGRAGSAVCGSSNAPATGKTGRSSRHFVGRSIDPIEFHRAVYEPRPSKPDRRQFPARRDRGRVHQTPCLEELQQLLARGVLVPSAFAPDDLKQLIRRRCPDRRWRSARARDRNAPGDRRDSRRASFPAARDRRAMPPVRPDVRRP